MHLSAGWAHTCAGLLTQAVGFDQPPLSNALCWGRATEGQHGPDAKSTNPVLIPTVVRVERAQVLSVGAGSVAADSAHSCFIGLPLGLEPQLICVGDTTWDQIGPVDTDEFPSGEVARLPFDTPAVVVVGGNGRGAHSCAIDNDDAMWCWGDNSFGQLGNPTVTGSTANPVRVAGGMVFSTITAGGLHTCGLTAQGEAYCWGDNAVGQIGDGTTTQAGIPVAVTGGLTFQSLSAGNYHTCGITTEGVGYCWGSGPLGVAGVTTSLVPIPIG